MWKCLYIFRSANCRSLPFVGMYRNSVNESLQVVRLKAIADAADFAGKETDQFTLVPARRPKKVFRTIYLSEGDPEWTLRAVDPEHANDIPDLGTDDLRDRLSNDSDE